MLRKKNYKQQEQYSEYHNFSFPLTSGRKVMVYFKRYRPKLTVSDKVVEIYDLINNKKDAPKIESPYPIDRTLELISFDGSLESKVEAILKKVGKIRKFEFGESSLKGKPIFFCIAVFKFEFDLVKCFREEFIQNIVATKFKIYQNEEGREDYKAELITKYLPSELESKNRKMKELHAEGYNLVTNKVGEFRVNRQSNEKWVENLPQVKKSKKMSQTQADRTITKTA